MTIVARATPGGYCIFCDDIRHEVNGKFSLIGVYGGELYPLGPYPLVLPKLCILIHYFQRIEDGFQDTKIRARLIGGVEEVSLFEMLISASDLQNTPFPEKPADPEAEPMLSLQVPLEFPHIVIAQPGRIRVDAYRGDDQIKLGTLKLSPPPSQNGLPEPRPTEPV